MIGHFSLSRAPPAHFIRFLSFSHYFCLAWLSTRFHDYFGSKFIRAASVR
jgi:hypothetical protein